MILDKDFNYESSCRRIRGIYRREKVDHIPIQSPIGSFPNGCIDKEKFGD